MLKIKYNNMNTYNNNNDRRYKKNWVDIPRLLSERLSMQSTQLELMNYFALEPKDVLNKSGLFQYKYRIWDENKKGKFLEVVAGKYANITRKYIEKNLLNN